MLLHRSFHTDAFTQTLLHTDTFTHRRFYTQTLLHTDTFTHKRFYTQHTEAFTQTRLHTEEIAILLQFFAIEPHSVRKRVAREKLKLQFYLSFSRSNLISCERGLRGRSWNRNFTSVFGDRTSFRAKEGFAGEVEIAILPQFLAIEPHFVRKGCVSCRLVGTAPAPAFRREIEKKESARGQEGKKARGEDVKMWGCEDVKMWGWEDVKMSRC